MSVMLIERDVKMTDEQIDKMLEMHRYLIKCELNTMVAKINREKDTELLQEAFNDTKWEEFAKWFKMIRDQ
jgi:hypothetical protein